MMNDRYIFKNNQKLTNQVKDLLEDYIDIIQDNNWTELYTQVDYDPDVFGQMTQILIESGIDPLSADDMDYVPENYFYENWNIISVNLPNKIRAIDSSAFEGCENLKYIRLPDNLEVLGSWAFHLCPSLKSITIPKTLTYFGDGNFNYCDELESVEFEGTCEQFLNLIEDNSQTFRYSSKLTEITCNDGFISIDQI